MVDQAVISYNNSHIDNPHNDAFRYPTPGSDPRPNVFIASTHALPSHVKTPKHPSIVEKEVKSSYGKDLVWWAFCSPVLDAFAATDWTTSHTLAKTRVSQILHLIISARRFWKISKPWDQNVGKMMIVVTISSTSSNHTSQKSYMRGASGDKW